MIDDRRERFEAAFSDNYDAIVGYALRRTDPDSAQEVVAETFLVAWRRVDDLPAEPRPWLYGIARRVLANHRRGAARREALTALLTEHPHVDDPPDGRVLEALASLRSTDREALMLTAWDGLDRREAAAALGCSPATFAVRLHRARRRLVRELADEGGPARRSVSVRLQ